MSNMITGIENDLTKGYQRVDNFGASLLDDTESVLSHPVASIQAAGVSAWDALNAGAGFVEQKLENVYDAVSDRVSNLDLVSAQQPAHHTSSQPSTSMVSRVESDVSGMFSRANLKKVLKWVIIFLAVYLVAGVLMSLFGKQQSVMNGGSKGGMTYSPQITQYDISALARVL